MTTKAHTTVILEQTKSPIGRPAEQRATLIGLGSEQDRPPLLSEGHAGRARHDRESRCISSASSKAPEAAADED